MMKLTHEEQRIYNLEVRIREAYAYLESLISQFPSSQVREDNMFFLNSSRDFSLDALKTLKEETAKVINLFKE